MIRAWVILSGGLLLQPVADMHPVVGPVEELVQPVIPPTPRAAPEKSVPGYACGHPRPGFEYKKLKGVGSLPSDILSGGWMCSDGCGAEIDCATYLTYGDQRNKLITEFAYVYRKRRD